jgi:metal-dependent amidase/aminoacylase/carboxypeptidase family protein
MILIKEVVQQALNNGYLSKTAQKQIDAILQTDYDSEDIDSLIILRRAIVAGTVRQEVSRKTATLPTTKKRTAANIKLAYQMAAEMAFAAALALTMPQSQQDQPSLGT